MAWPPGRSEFYFPEPPSGRPLFQGDVFSDVPFLKAKGGSTHATEPEVTCERRCVALLGYPCDIYAGGGRTLVRTQPVVLVRQPTGLRIPADWRGAYSICPLPDLFGDGETWAADFTKLANVDRSYLDSDRRIACLSELGWAIFRERVHLAMTRAATDRDRLMALGHPTWLESVLQTEVVEAGDTIATFQDWLDEPMEPEEPDLTRRRALTAGREADVRREFTRWRSEAQDAA